MQVFGTSLPYYAGIKQKQQQSSTSAVVVVVVVVLRSHHYELNNVQYKRMQKCMDPDQYGTVLLQ